MSSIVTWNDHRDDVTPDGLEGPARMERLAAQAADDLADAPAQEVIGWAVETFGDRIAVTSSMTDAVIIHLAAEVQPGIDVIFLDTGYHFAETIGTRDAVATVYPVNVINVTPSRTVAQQDAALGPRLYGRNPTSAATCARSYRWSARWILTMPGSPASAGRKRAHAATPGWSSGTPGARW